MSTELENMPVVSAEKTPKPVASESDGDCYRTFARLSIWLPLGAGVLCRGARAALGGMEGAAAHSALMTCAWFLGLAVMASVVIEPEKRLPMTVSLRLAASLLQWIVFSKT